MAISIFLNRQNCQQVIYHREDAFEKFTVDNAETIFGVNSIYINMKHRIENSSLGGTIPDGVLIDLSDLENPEFYIVEIELQSHDFFKHIFPQITKFFAFYKNSTQQQKLIEKIFSIFKQDNSLRNKLKELIGTREIYKFLKDTLENSQNILIIVDGTKPEFEEIMDTYTDTWGKIVKVQIVSHFQYEDHHIIISDPPFQNIEFSDAITSTITVKSAATSQYSEEFHLKDRDENVRDIYNRLKQCFLEIKGTISLNSTKYYIGVLDDKNIAFIKFRKRKIVMVVLLPEKEVRNILSSQYHKVVSLSESVQRFWAGNNPNCSVEICDTKHFEEIEILLQKIVSKNEDR